MYLGDWAGWLGSAGQREGRQGMHHKLVRRFVAALSTLLVAAVVAFVLIVSQ
jgi:succinate dehydrogenase hydrophobic anchor subunit